MTQAMELFGLYKKRTGFARTDLRQLAVFDRDKSTEYTVLELFWAFLHPEKLKDGALTDASAERLDPDIHTGVIETLTDLERRLRPENEPDSEPWSDGWFEYLHIAGARGLFLASAERFSEEAKRSLEEVRRAAVKLDVSPYFGWTEAPAGIISAWAVTGVVNFVLSEAMLSEGKDDGAIERFADGFRYYTSAYISRDEPVSHLGLEDPASLREEEIWRFRFEKWLSPPQVSAQKAADAALRLLNSRGTHAWAALAKACEDIGNVGARIDWETMPEIRDDRGDRKEWKTFWLTTAGMLKSRLSPDQLIHALRQAEDDASTERLRTYFFPPPRGLDCQISPNVRSSRLNKLGFRSAQAGSKDLSTNFGTLLNLYAPHIYRGIFH